MGFADLPNTWYCIPRVNPDIGAERQGILVFAWRLFIAMNWPGKADKAAQKEWVANENIDGLNKKDQYPRWATWPSPQALREALNPKCDKPKLCRHPPVSWTDNPSSLTSQNPGSSDGATRCVYDQRGNLVEYEVRVSLDGWASNVFDSACGGTGWNPSADWCESPPPSSSSFDVSQEDANITLRYGQCQGRGVGTTPDQYSWAGAMAIKLAWKVLSPEESENGRYLQREAKVGEACADNSKVTKQTLGLVGFHITQKTNGYRDWIWSTFEHVDNLTPADGATAASFHDPKCTDCVANTSQRHSGECRTQITRVLEIPEDVRRTNEQFHGLLKEKSVLQYYELIGVQYRSADPSVASPKATPEQLRNSVIETYMAVDRPIPNSCTVLPKDAASSCLGCHKDGADSSFVPRVELCSCTDKKKWVGDDTCRKKLWLDCPKRPAY